jgi:alkaline phosphatase D
VTWYPEDRPQGMYARKLRDVVRFETGEKIRDFHVPVTVDDYRALYRAYLEDPDLQDARARWPFVCMWDNHEFSWRGWQSIRKFDGPRPGQTRKVAANQAWFEYQPARVVASGGDPRTQFTAPTVADVPVESFDDRGLGQEPNNLAAIRSLVIYRSLRWGKHLDLILTDNRSFAMESAMDRPEVKPFQAKEFPFLAPLEVIEAFDIIHQTVGCDRRIAGISWRTSGSHSSFPARKILAPLPGVRPDLPRAAWSRSTFW